MNPPDILDLIKQKGEIVYFRSGKNHPWRKYNIFAKKLPPIGNDPDHVERNQRLCNNYQPNLDPFVVKVLREMDHQIKIEKIDYTEEWYFIHRYALSDSDRLRYNESR